MIIVFICKEQDSVDIRNWARLSWWDHGRRGCTPTPRSLSFVDFNLDAYFFLFTVPSSSSGLFEFFL